ncbi:hypothetical protein GALL_515420 [mine drainage metagenome]|uniref:Uncharacterized protein n=1 Tax=mine drainage metagenome TaxID=410659 RepID=A0A1J5PTJ9_9ZZZZ
MSISRNDITAGWPKEIPGRPNSKNTLTAAIMPWICDSTAAASSALKVTRWAACAGKAAGGGASAAIPKDAITSCSIQRRTSAGALRIWSVVRVIPIMGCSPLASILRKRGLGMLIRIKLPSGNAGR